MVHLKISEFEEQRERIETETAMLRRKLTRIANNAGVTDYDMRFFDPGSAGFNTVCEVITTLLASVDRLSLRVAKLENNEQ